MKFAPALALVSSVLLIPLAHAAAPSPKAGGAPNVAAAKQGLDAAMAKVTEAMKRANADAPTAEDLEAAHAALETLKTAIDAGAEFEPQDLDYAKEALTARRELRTDREVVEDRRAKIQIFNHRRVIDQALSVLSEQVKGLEGKEPTAKDFDAARAALSAVKAALDPARQFTKQDEKFATYVQSVDATMAKDQKAIDDRWASLLADKHRDEVKQSRQALSEAIAALGKGATDAQFDAANKAVTGLSKLLDDGKVLEAKDKAYKADAEHARAELAQAKTKMAAALGEVALTRLKSEIDPAYKDLLTVSKALKARKPTADQLAEARTAAIVVRKLVDKYQTQAGLNPAFGAYVNDVKKALTEVEVDLEKRSLDGARADLTQALRNLERRDASDEQFGEAKTAQTVLEKTLQSVHTRAPELSASVGDAKKLLDAAKTTMTKRRLEVDIRNQRAKVDEAKKNTNAVMTDLFKADAKKEVLTEAEKAIKILAATLDAGAPLAKKDHDYATYATDVKKRIADLTDRVAKRRVAIAVRDAKALLGETLATAKAKLDTAKQPTSTDADVDAATKSVAAIEKALESNQNLEPQDAGYVGQVNRALVELQKLHEALDLATKAHALRKATVQALAAGQAAAEAGGGATDLRAQKGQFEKAVAQFRSCEEDGNGMIKETHALATVPVVLNGQPSTAKDVIALCSDQFKATDAKLKAVAGLIMFEDGPKRSFEAGERLFNDGKKDEALSQYLECVSSGLILESNNPELKDRKFPVAGTNLTLVEVVKRCVAQRNALRGHK